MRIIEINAFDNGSHRNQIGTFTTIPEGWAIIPDNITIPDTFPFVSLKVENGIVINMSEGIIPKKPTLTHEEINEMIVAKIREKYDVNEEFKMINLGISDPTNKDYIAYREYVTSCIAWGDDLFLETEVGEDINE